jgi:hypothetical protein
LFPFTTDFEEVRQYSQQFTRIVGGSTGMPFRKVDTRIEVGETITDFIFTPYNLARWKWFNHDCLPATFLTIYINQRSVKGADIFHLLKGEIQIFLHSISKTSYVLRWIILNKH